MVSIYGGLLQRLHYSSKKTRLRNQTNCSLSEHVDDDHHHRTGEQVGDGDDHREHVEHAYGAHVLVQLIALLERDVAAALDFGDLLAIHLQKDDIRLQQASAMNRFSERISQAELKFV